MLLRAYDEKDFTLSAHGEDSQPSNELTSSSKTTEQTQSLTVTTLFVNFLLHRRTTYFLFDCRFPPSSASLKCSLAFCLKIHKTTT